MNALLNPANHAGGRIKWLFVVHTVTMFSIVTIFTATYLDLHSISYVDNREFPGNDALPPGPLGYQHSIFSEAITLAPRVMFVLNNWLADGLLVSFAFTSVACVPRRSRSSSSIVAALFMP